MELHTIVLLSAFGIAIVLGAVAHKTNFCTMGAVSDWVNIGDTGRMRAWVFAIAVAMGGVVLLEYFQKINLDVTVPAPFRSSNFEWLRYVVGGIMFGIGMTFSSGCGNKTLIRLGGGNLKSIFVILIIGAVAYMMTNPIATIQSDKIDPATNKAVVENGKVVRESQSVNLYNILFDKIVQSTSIDLSKIKEKRDDKGAIITEGITKQDIPTIVSKLTNTDVRQMRLFVGGGIVALLLVFVFWSKDFRGHFDNFLGGLVVGLCVLAAWVLTSLVLNSWNDAKDLMDYQPRGIGVQSFTFINPLGQAISLFDPGVQKAVPYVTLGFQKSYLTFGVVAGAGVIFGSLLFALIGRSFRFEWFSSFGDFFKHSFGAVLMGIGGVLALGCTIGQGITGVSTLALGSVIVFFSIIFGSALTMKVQLYRMVYEKAGFFTVLVSALADLRLLPKFLKKLEAI